MKDSPSSLSPSVERYLWNLFCGCSIAGIWPRFIEPNLLLTSHLSLPIQNLAPVFHNFKILQLSDLHLHASVSESFLDKLVNKSLALKPDVIVFTGDFLCYAKMALADKLCAYLQRFHAPYGCYAVLGNHDYANFVSINAEGSYDAIPHPKSTLTQAFKRLSRSISLKKHSSLPPKITELNDDLTNLLAKTPFKLLHNTTTTIVKQGSALNLCGLGEYMAGHMNLQKAFENYDCNNPGIILLHNPDGIPFLKNFPGQVVLCGHTHGGQINLPWIWKKFTLMENMKFKKGLSQSDNKWVYVNRGLGSTLPFRFCSPPELLLLTLEAT